MKFIATFAALALIGTAPAIAQQHSNQIRPTQNHTVQHAPPRQTTPQKAPIKKPQVKAPQRAPQAKQRQNIRTNYQPPKSWKGSKSAYQTHAKSCQSRYRSYNPRTNSYTVRAGKTAICR